MTKKIIKASDILGNNYYIYELTSSNYTPALNGTITITCAVTDVYGDPINNKSITLYQNDTSVSTQTTNSSGVATWSITCSTAGLQSFSIKDTSIEVFVDNKEDTSNKVTSLSSSSTDTQYPSAKCVYDTVDIVDDKVSVVYNTVSIIDTSDNLYDADRWTEAGTMTIARTSKNKVIGGGGSENGYVIYNGNISNLDNYDITLNLKANRTGTNVYINDNNIGTLPTSQTSILFKKRDGVVKVVYDNNQYNASAVKFMSSNAMSMTRYTIDVVLYQGMIYDVIDSIPSKTSDLTNDSGFLTSHQSLSGYLQTSDVKDNLTSTDTNKPLSANQGKELKSLVDNKLPYSNGTYLMKMPYYLNGDATNFSATEIGVNGSSDFPIFALIKNTIADNNDNATLKFRADGSDVAIIDFTKSQPSPISANVWKKDSWGLFFCYGSTVQLKAIFYDSDILDTNYIQKSNTDGLLKNDGTVMTSGTNASNFATGNHTHSAYINPTIADNLTTNDSNQVLSAKQGKILNDLIGQAISYINQ